MHHRKKMDMKNKEKKKGNELNGSHTDVSLTTTLSLRTISSKTNKNTKQKKICFQVWPFHNPHILSAITDLFRAEKKREIQKGTKTGVWRASRGKVQVCHSSCASQYKNATTRTTLLSTRQVRGRPSPPRPRSLLNKKGLGNWQASLLIDDAMHSLHCTVFSSPVLYLLRLSTHVKKEKLWESAIFCLFSCGRRVIALLYSETPLPTLSFLWLLLRLTISFVRLIPPYVSHSLSVSMSESDHCTGVSFPFRWAYSMTAV